MHPGRRPRLAPVSSARLALALGLGALLAAPAAAELLRCQGPDGNTIFTDDPARCPGAEPFEPGATLQSAPGAASPEEAGEIPPAAARQRQRELAAEAQAAEARRWARKKSDAEEEMRQVAKRRDHLRQYVAHCHRGGDVLTRDDAGIKRTVSCDSLDETFAELEAREEELRDYLAEGLAEECRKAGCLPGWIR